MSNTHQNTVLPSQGQHQNFGPLSRYGTSTTRRGTSQDAQGRAAQCASVETSTAAQDGPERATRRNPGRMATPRGDDQPRIVPSFPHSYPFVQVIALVCLFAHVQPPRIDVQAAQDGPGCPSARPSISALANSPQPREHGARIPDTSNYGRSPALGSPGRRNAAVLASGRGPAGTSAGAAAPGRTSSRQVPPARARRGPGTAANHWPGNGRTNRPRNPGNLARPGYDRGGLAQGRTIPGHVVEVPPSATPEELALMGPVERNAWRTWTLWEERAAYRENEARKRTTTTHD